MLRSAQPEVAADYHEANTATLGKLEPEKLLMIAVMQDALDALDGHVTAGTYTLSKSGRKNDSLMLRRREQVKREARRWFASNEDWWPFQFVVICDYLGYDAEAVRAQIRERLRKKAA